MSLTPESTHQPTAGSSNLSGLFKGNRSRRNSRIDDSSTLSLASNGLSNDGSTTAKRPSLDGALDKLMDKTRRQSDDRRSSISSEKSGSTQNRVSKLFSRRKAKKKTNNPGASMSTEELEQELQSRRGSGLHFLPNPNPSEESLQLHKSVASSLLTEDSDVDSPPPRPTLSPRQSHAGYLTLSSPLIASETRGSNAFGPAVETSQSLDDTLAPEHASTSDVYSSQKRSTSPVGKLKDAFVPARRSTTPKLVGPGETDTVKSAGSNGGLGNLFAGKKGDSGSRRGSKDTEELPQHTNTGVSAGESTVSINSTASPRRIDTSASVPSTPLSVHEAPTTLITPPTPTEPRAPRSGKVASNVLKSATDGALHKTSQSESNIVTSPSGNMISHRRARSGTNPPSKLSNSISAPLTPTVEEAKTPGGTLTSLQASSSSFFSSVFSAAQNAANSLTNTIGTINNNPRNRSGTGGSDQSKENQSGGEEVIPGSPENTIKKKPLAIETLGSGNLSFSHLGIVDPSEPSPMASKTDLSNGSTLDNDEAAANAEDTAAARAISAAYLDRPNGDEKAGSTTESMSGDRDRSRSFTGIIGDRTPPRTPANDLDSSGIRRSGSVRSRISEKTKGRRHRGSSATTGHSAIAAAISQTHTGLANPSSSAQRLTGFAVASSKRNRDFHGLFRSVPEDDYLIEDYSAALQKDILLHGRLYVSEGHMCFSSNILGWVTNLVISFDEVVSVEKKSTAVIFPNAIVIQTLHARNVFASFVSRDSTYDLIIGIWKISHPNLKSSVNGVMLDNEGTGDKTEKAESMGTNDDSEEGSDDEVYDEDAEEEEDNASYTEGGEGSIVGSDLGDLQSVSRKTSAAVVGQPVANGTAKDINAVEAALTGAVASADFPGPTTHAPTDCGDGTSHYDKLLVDTVIAAPLGKIYSMMFGPASGSFMRKWLIDEQKSMDLQLEDDGKGVGPHAKTFSYSFIKPLYAAIGPKQTKCIINQSLEQFDLEKAVTVLCSTQNPDVPSGNIFVVKTRYCLSWGPNNGTRLIMTCTVEWSGKSWLKGPIEKGANDGQTQYAKDIVAALRAAVSAKPLLKSAPKGKAGKGRRRKEISDAPAPVDSHTTSNTRDRAGNASRGLLEPLRSVFGPIVDLLGTATVITAIFFILASLFWFSRPSSGPGVNMGGIGLSGIATPQRIAAYEEIWRREESELWKWLEDRMALDRISADVLRDEEDLDRRRRLRKSKSMEGRLEDEAMTEREIDEAIRVTQERLEALKDAVERRKQKGRKERDASIPG
ncbi:hypothetical protein M501DRAFT_939097 [Patellaria atrata CBS 101060]|uniref:VASt domain-containing protein n=1 Tax=Patellaria atrata CBS 101060 TaxID=1346257 RepID=A0A9P4S7K3_9PEZI|nr:hypothetical protein M501DRAFT_939097 [Patellaria atrata CBS 101060]